MFEKVTIHTINSDGWHIDFELKPHQQPKPALDWLASNGYQPTPTAVVAPSSASVAPEETAVGTFAAEQMTATLVDGKTYWKVKGGQFQKFGVSIWPEALEASGFNPDELDPTKPVDLVGYTAHYITKENGQPKKIIKLS